MTIKEELDSRLEEENENLCVFITEILPPGPHADYVKRIIKLALTTGGNVGMEIAIRRISKSF